MSDDSKLEAERTALARERTALANERNRLSIERTFLSWTRTGLGVVGGGIAILRLLFLSVSHHQMLARLAGITLGVLGIAIFILAFLEYRNSCKKLHLQHPYAGSVWFISVFTVTLCILSIILLFIAYQ